MEFHTVIIWNSPFLFKGVLGGIFHFYSSFYRKLCKQTVETLIRRRILWRLIWVCTICLCPTKRTLGIYGFYCNYFAYLIRVAEIWKYIVEIIFLGTSDLSKFINMKIKERQCHITKRLVHSFSVNIRISQPSKVMFTSALPR